MPVSCPPSTLSGHPMALGNSALLTCNHSRSSGWNHPKCPGQVCTKGPPGREASPRVLHLCILFIFYSSLKCLSNYISAWKIQLDHPHDFLFSFLFFESIILVSRIMVSCQYSSSFFYFIFYYLNEFITSVVVYDHNNLVSQDFLPTAQANPPHPRNCLLWRP